MNSKVTYQEAEKALADQYQDQFAKQTAREELGKLYQANRTFDEFYKDFLKYVTAARIDEEAQLYKLRRKLSSELSRALESTITDDLAYFV